MPEAMTESESTENGMLKWLWLTMLIVALDLGTKALISSQFLLYESREVIPGWFNLTLAHNTGAAFSFLANESGWQRWFFTVIAVLVSVVIFFWIKRLPKTERWLAMALALVLGGALGNLWDRVTLGYVVDFLDFYIQYESNEGPKAWHWPAFNVADMAIFIGASMLLIDVFRPNRNSQED